MNKKAVGLTKFVLIVTLLIGILGAFVGTASAKGAGGDLYKVCLQPGSFVMTMPRYGNDIFILKMDAASTISVSKVQVLMNGGAFDQMIAADGCHIYFTWAKPGQLPDLWVINPATNFGLKPVTRTATLAEFGPIIVGNTITYATIGRDGIGNTVSMNLGNYDQRTLVSDLSSTLPTSLSQIRAFSMRPSGSIAAVVTKDGNLVFQPYRDGVPTSYVIPGPGLSNLTSVTWIEVK